MQDIDMRNYAKPARWPAAATAIGLVLLSSTAAGGQDAAYGGRNANAPWRRAAAERIETLRKAPLVVRVVDAVGKPVAGARVEVKMRRHAFGFGSAVTARMLCLDDGDGRRYRKIVAENYTKVVFENDLKWRPWEVGQRNTSPVYRRQWVDRSFRWLADHEIAVRGHYVTWAPLKGEQIALYKGKPDKLRADLYAHMRDKLPAVGKRVVEWDAVNHIAGWGTTVAKVSGSNEIYADIITLSRTLAPGVLLYVNEGQILPGGGRIDAYEKIIRDLRRYGAAPDGVGFMGHFSRKSLTAIDEIHRRLDRFATLAGRLQLTELDVDVGADEKLHADYLRDVMTIAFAHPAMDGIVMWGFWAGRHWKPNASLYRRDWSITPAGRAWRDLVFTQWWTTVKGTTDANGLLKVRGFLGRYDVTAVAAGKTAAAQISLPKPGRDVKITLEQ